ncbi:dolichyl-phosphate-mannose-protein mannosyltransferase [Galdieria sulphuraria]|uniref:Dolichyl-phosphate-mannose-protein mannosyltransferase n=1 Tax=Galdieria sulphuraria TaxID=130081 RepID=M2X7H8_GALSU|nr:dolichyl-phosphate-mannose-protein mannosyltransferase [Galdieria sulphuraria]EME32480.1 dolichyl-phosphate-mannose-protein mannosyltransferase [Galdieria sulphuraria]|eukprot:XP_005709000.1 dolichyl-phosphate-mannose-protein mannosyltransferase [Galdieria sulphuraria]
MESSHKVDTRKPTNISKVSSQVQYYYFTKKDAIFLLVLTLLSFLTRFYRLDEPPAVVFDEFHFGKFVTWYFTGEYFFDIHPPLGKLFLYLGGTLGKFKTGFLFDAIGAEYGETKFYVLRSVSGLFGTLSVPFMYLLCRVFGLSVESSILGSSLVLFDFMSLIESRLILVDSQLQFFCIVSLLSAFMLWNSCPKTWSRMFWLIMTAMLSGFAISIKWTALATPGAIAIASFFGLFLMSRPLDLWECALAGLVGLITYVIPFYIHFRMLPLSGTGDAFMSVEFQKTLKGSPYYDPIFPPESFWKNFLYLNKEMLRANSAIKERHPWESKWYEWPLNLRGLLYYTEELENGLSRQIYLIGNPVVMYVCILFALSFFFCLIFYCRYRYLISNDIELARLLSKGMFLFLAYSLNLFPYIAVDRSAFLYHYIPGLLYAELLTALMIDSFPKQGQKWIVTMILLLELLAFLYWAPWIYCIPLSATQHQRRRWLPRWN